MRKQIFVLSLLILCQANRLTEESQIQGKFRGKNKVIPNDKIGKTNYLDNDIDALLILQQKVRNPNSHHNRHQVIRQIKEATYPSISTQKIKYHQSQSQTKENLKDHINMLEKAQTEEESKLCYDLIDDSRQSLIISENIVNQLEPQQTIDSFKDTVPKKPKQEQPQTINLYQNKNYPHVSDPNKLVDKESSESNCQDDKIEGRKIKKRIEGSKNKGKQAQGLIDDKVKDKSEVDRILAPPNQNKASHQQYVSKQIDSKNPIIFSKNKKSFRSKKQIPVKLESYIFKDKVIEDQNNNQEGYSDQNKDYYKEDKIVAQDKIKQVSKLKKDKKIKKNKHKLKHTSKKNLQSTLNENIGQVRFNDGQEIFTKEVINKTKTDIIGNNIGNKKYIKQARKLDLSTREAKEMNSSLIGKEPLISKELSENESEKEPPFDDLAGQKMILSSFNGKIQLEKEFKEDQLGSDLQEYGYGFYIRFLTQYPTQMLGGKREAWYIIARLTKNEKYADVRMGDRILAIWQGQAIYLPATTDIPKNPNFHQNVPYGDIEGVWTFIYFSYSLPLQKATFLLKYDGNDEIFRRDFKCNHGAITYLKFIVGGASPPYQGFNGQIANTAIMFGLGAYIDDLSKSAKHLNNRIPSPPGDDNSFKSVEILKGVDEAPFKADKSAQPYEIWAIESESTLKSQYSVTGWIRWDTPPVSSWYNVWRLSLYKEEDNLNTKRLGDRDHTLFKQLDYYHFTSYSYSNLNGAGESNLWQNIPHGSLHLQWHFIFSGYNRNLRQMYHHITFIDEQKEVITPNINHFVLYKHYFQFGKDFKKWERIHNGFQGIASKIQLNYGDGAYQIKPFDKPDALFYSFGIQKYHRSFDFREVTPSVEDLIPASANQIQPIFDIQLLDAKDNIRGLQEYGWTTWVKWMRTGPTNLIWMAPPHLIGRLTINKNHQDKGLGDRTLSCWLVAKQYQFRTYTSGNNDSAINMGYQFPDGSWNLISWTYKKYSARAIVWMNEKFLDSQELKVIHQPVGDFLRFVSLKEFVYQAFHGFYAKVSLRLGEGAYIDQKQFEALLNGELKLPESLIPSQQRISVALQKDLIKVKHDQFLPDIIISEDIANGKDEYSVSGWAKFVDPALGPWNIVIRVSTNSPSVLNDLAAPGDRTFGIWKGQGFYHFCTYTSDQENGGSWALCQNSDYQGLLHKNWVFIYFGYSRSLKKAFVYIKYETKQDELSFDVLHQVPYKFYIQLKKDKWYDGFQGLMENWYLNVGAGSFKETGFDVGEQDDQTFGFGGRVRPPIKQWQSLDLFQQRWKTERKVGVEIEYKNDDSINGLQEYGYGFWFRFVWNGPDKMVNKPSWLALSRLTINQNYEGDARSVGDRQLAVWVGSRFFHFTTSQIGDANIWNNVYYDQMLDGQWNLLYYGYKRTDKGGKVLGHILFDGLLMRSTEFQVVNLFPVQDYLYLSVGSSGSKLLNNYFSFNGQIAGIRLVLGEGGLVETDEDLKKFGGNKPELPKIPQVKKTIIEKPKEMKRGQSQVQPFEYYDEFDGADEYAVSIWFKWSTIERASWEIIFQLTYNEEFLIDDNLKQGDHVLGMYQNRDHRILFQSYSTPDSHDTYAYIYNACSVPHIDQTRWVYGYQAYSRKSASLVSYLKTITTDYEKKIEAMHRVPGYFGLYVGKNGYNTPYNGLFAYLYLWAGEGSYREKDYLSFQPYLAGAVLPDSQGVLFSQKPEKNRTLLVHQDKDSIPKYLDSSIELSEIVLKLNKDKLLEARNYSQVNF